MFFFDEFKNPDYEIIKNVAYDFVSYNENLESLVNQADCICFGTLAQRNQVSKLTLQQLLQQFKGTYRFYDLNLRKECYSIENIITSLKNTDILKMNKQEASEISTLLQLNKTGLVEIGKSLINTFELKYCVISLEEFGSIAFSKNGEIVYSPGFEIKITDPLGSGDAFSAGFVDALLRGKSLFEASETGNCLGALVATQKGATQKITQNDLQKISGQCKRISDKKYLEYMNKHN
jgi:fructokinase